MQAHGHPLSLAVDRDGPAVGCVVPATGGDSAHSEVVWGFPDSELIDLSAYYHGCPGCPYCDSGGRSFSCYFYGLELDLEIRARSLAVWGEETKPRCLALAAEPAPLLRLVLQSFQGVTRLGVAVAANAADDDACC